MNALTAILAIDVGFEFVDLVLDRGGELMAAKHRVGRASAAVAIIDAIELFSREADFEIARLGAIRLASTGGINALLTRRGARVALIANEGFGDTLYLGRQNRRDLFDPVARLASPSFLVRRSDIHELRGRLDAVGREIEGLDMTGLSAIADVIASDPVDAVAICLLHAHIDATHEQQCAEFITRRFPELPVIVSHVADPNPREFERTVSTCLEAWLRPAQAGMMRQLDQALAERGFAGSLQFANGSGQLQMLEAACANVSAHLTSGPASAARHAADLSQASDAGAAIAIDIGSTTTDMALILNGKPVMTRHLQVAEVPLRQVVNDVQSCALGGLARALPDGLGGITLAVSNDPAWPTLSDCLACLGLISLEPADDAVGRLENLARETGTAGIENAARAAVIAVERSVAQAVLRYAVQRNVDPARTTLVAMGGLGPALVPGVVEMLGGGRLLVPALSAVAGAMGLLTMAPSQSTRIRVDADLRELGPKGVADCVQRLRSGLRAIEGGAVERLDIDLAPTASMHPFGIHLDIPGAGPETITAAFAEQYAARFGMAPPFTSLHVFAMTLTHSEAEPERNWPAPPENISLPGRSDGWDCKAVSGGFMMTRSTG